MHIHYVSIFPEIYTSFLETSLLKKAILSEIISVSCINPRDFVTTKHKNIDDEIYGGGVGMLIKAQPMIDAVQAILTQYELHPGGNRLLLFPSPAPEVFSQQQAYAYSKKDHIIFVAGRYEGIDARFQQYREKHYPENFVRISLGSYITLGGETPSMVMTEAITRLIPGVIKEEASHLGESYDPNMSMTNIEYPQYTRPEEVYGMTVPETLLQGNHAAIQKRKEDATVYLPLQ